MLKVINKEIVKKESIKFDIYVPINIEFEVENISEEPTIYWRTGNFIDSLIEIGVGKYKKDIRSITLTICKNVYETDNYFNKNFNVLNGSPIVCLGNINDEIYVDEIGELKAYIESKSITIIFSDNEAYYCLQNDNLCFYLNKNNFIIGLKINNIIDEYKKLLKKSLLYSE